MYRFRAQVLHRPRCPPLVALNGNAGFPSHGDGTPGTPPMATLAAHVVQGARVAAQSTLARGCHHVEESVARAGSKAPPRLHRPLHRLRRRAELAGVSSARELMPFQRRFHLLTGRPACRADLCDTEAARLLGRPRADFGLWLRGRRIDILQAAMRKALCSVSSKWRAR